ncbi:MAG: hypothetical protein WB630_01830 [Candidatus Acidiferrales bacterium]
MDPELNVLLAVTGFLQLGALATRIAGRKRAALAMAGANAALALALTLLISGGALMSREKIGASTALFVALEATAAGAAAVGLAKRRESGWLFWPVWLWNFVYALVRLRFFLRLYF